MSKNYDSAFCGSLPLNFINTVQPYGLLLALERDTLCIRQTSENAEFLFALPVANVVNQNLSEFIPPAEFQRIQNKLHHSQLKDRIPLHFTFAGKKSLAIAHFQKQMILLEIEPQDTDVSDFASVYEEIKYIVALLKEAKNASHLLEIATQEIKKLSGFDKVMIYQFGPDWNGNVVAEQKEENMDSYLGLRFPASDVPKQARDLYLKNPYRWIPEATYVPVKLHPVLNPITFTFTDLADCNLRGVAPVHLEYLRNMRVGASMSTPIVKNDQLWGLITCHHQTPRLIHHDIRCAFELLSTLISTQLAAKEKEEVLVLGAQLDGVQAQLYKQMIAGPTFIDGLLSRSVTLLELLMVEGVAITFEDKIYKLGNVPPENHIKEMNYWLKINKINKVYATDTVDNSIDINYKHKDVASGFIAIPIHPRKNEYIIGFRPEVIQNVAWGGDPNSAIQFEKDKKTYHPRHSFAVWQETVQNTSTPWQSVELEAAETLQNTIKEMLTGSQN